MKYGGKANSLLYLASNNILVPKFFIISKDDYIMFLKANKIYTTIRDLSLEKKYQSIKELIMKQDINKELEVKIDRELPLLNGTKFAVRSSSLEEDGTTKSYAGQFESFLNVDKEDIFNNIKKCWCSLYNNNVIDYSSDFDLYGMNVIIQTMILPDYSGVIFTIDPTSDTNNYSIVEIVEGLCEKLVSGKVTPTKYLIRKETKKIDFAEGPIKLRNNIVNNIMDEALKIEKLYSKPMDIEYAIKDNKCYILQARPITSVTPLPKPFTLSITRQKSIIDIEIYYKGEYEGIKRLTRNLYYFKPLFVYNKKDNVVDVYYNNVDLEEHPGPMYYYLDKDYAKTEAMYNLVLEDINYLNNVIDNNLDIDYKKYIAKLIDIYPFTSLGQIAGKFKNVSPRIKEILIEFREKYDYIIYKAVDYILLKNKEYHDIDFITLDELMSNKIPDKDTIEKRKKGYIYYNGNLYTSDNYDAFFKEHNIYLEEVNINDLKGQITSPINDNIKGKVSKVFNDTDLRKFKEGDILVTPMTTPKYMDIIKKARAIITDEGGVLSHAAIISRELKVPCVVGCKKATKVLKNGDLIEINKRGEIKLL